MGEPEDTRFLVKEDHPIYGNCQNQNPIPGFKQCEGQCSSKSVYIPALFSQTSQCYCCQVLVEENLKVEMTCEDGNTYYKEIKVPNSCKCSTCISEGTVLTDTHYPYGYGVIPGGAKSEDNQKQPGNPYGYDLEALSTNEDQGEDYDISEILGNIPEDKYDEFGLEK